MNNKDLLRLLDEFINEKGLYWTFLEYVEKRGYDPDQAESMLMNVNE